jgi:hypothetical protein
MALWILKAGTIPYRGNGRGYKNAKVSAASGVVGGATYSMDVMASQIFGYNSANYPMRVLTPSVTPQRWHWQASNGVVKCAADPLIADRPHHSKA